MQARAGQRHDDVPEDLPVAARRRWPPPRRATGGMVSMNWRSRKVPKALNAAGTISPRYESSRSQLHHQRVVGDHRHHAGDHQRGQVERNTWSRPRPVQPREGVGRHRAGEALEERHPRRDEEAVEVVAGEGNLLEDLRVVPRLPASWGTGLSFSTSTSGLKLASTIHRNGTSMVAAMQHEQQVARAETAAAAPPAAERRGRLRRWPLAFTAGVMLTRARDQ